MSVLSNRFSDAGKEAGDYTRAVLGLLGDRDPIAVLEQMPAELTRIVTRLMKDDLARPGCAASSRRTGPRSRATTRIGGPTD